MEESNCPVDFRCPISMDLMSDPVTISTGVTYDRKNIEKWFFTFKKTTCPATMQFVHSFHLTPNHTLKRLILSWQNTQSSSSPPPPPPFSAKHDELASLLSTVESSPFKVTALKKLRSVVEIGDETKSDFIRSGGVEILAQIIVQILIDVLDFVAFRACEEALGVLHKLPLSDSEDQNSTFEILSKTEQALVEHGLGIAAVSKKLMLVSNTATKIGVRIMWLIGSFHPTERVLDEMLMCGSVKKLLALLHLDGRSSTKEKVINMLKLHGNYWSKYPCFPHEMKNYLGF
ncbi:hypothetical protein SLE2022_072870 [Rubroshorea leprosula]